MTSVEQTSAPATALPRWSSVLAVVAHPDDESFGLGAVVDSFVRAGRTVSVLCLTRGEASTLGANADLGALRVAELQNAAKILGVDSAVMLDHPDGALAEVDSQILTSDVLVQIERSQANGLLVFDPSGVTRHPDHAAATAAALSAARCANLPVLGWTVPETVARQLNDEFGAGFVGHDPAGVDLVIPVDRDRQRTASLAHTSQSVPTSVLWRRLELLGDREHLRWLTGRSTSAAVRVEHCTDDQFAVAIRNHVLFVDQPLEAGGSDTAPTPTELFVASLAACVAFYVRRYLRRHDLDTAGLAVDASFILAEKPARVDGVTISITLDTDLPAPRRDALLAVARHCTVHNSITTPPDISINLRTCQDQSPWAAAADAD